MNLPYEFRVGWRYTRAGRALRRNGFISFISGVSMLGIALGVAALIIVLSVMNGFQKEVRDRMLSVVPHIEVFNVDGTPLVNWQHVASLAKQQTDIRGAAPFVVSQVLIARGEDMRGAVVRGILPEAEESVTPIASQLKEGPLKGLQAGKWGIVLGDKLATQLDLHTGDSVTLITPNGQVTPAGLTPRMKRLTLVGTFSTGHYEYDSSMALMHIADAEKLFRTGGPTGVQLRLNNAQHAPEISYALGELLGHKVDANLYVRDWTRNNVAWFSAVQIEKRMMFIILTLIVAVAAFNLVSTLVMTVTDKQADIAILRTLGSSPRSIMSIFMVQGALSGVVGTFAGLVLGLLVACNVDVIVPSIEKLFRVSFLPPSIYLINSMPSDPQVSDIVPIVVISLLLAFLATLYPSWRASRVKPAQALRYE